MVCGSLTVRRFAIVAVYGAAVVAAYIMFLLLIEQRISEARAFERQAELPLVLIGKGSAAVGTAGECILALLVLVQAIFLVCFYREAIKYKNDRRLFIVVATCVAAMSILSLRTNFTSSDMYHYIFYGKSASLADTYRFSPQNYPVGFEGLASAIHDNPVAPSVYGPLWQEADRILISPTQGLERATMLIRIWSLIALLALFVVIGLLRTNVADVGILALNPGLYYTFVVHAHNDISGILLVTTGIMLFARRQPMIAIVMLIMATAIKIIFVVVALAILRVEQRQQIRFISAIAIIIGCVVISYAFGGLSYIRAIITVGGGQAGIHSSIVEHFVRFVLFGLFAVESLILIVAGIVSRSGYRLGSLSFPGLSALLHPWYFGWGLPYSLTGTAMILPFAALLPVLSFATDTALTDATSVHFASGIMLVIGVVLGRDIIIHRCEGRAAQVDADA